MEAAHAVDRSTGAAVSGVRSSTPNHEPHGQVLGARAHLVVERGEYALGGEPAELLEVRVDARELGTGVRREDLPVVVADDGDVFRHPPTEVAQCVENAASDLVGAADDAVDLGMLREEHRRGIATPVLRPDREHRVADEFEAGRL